MGIATNFFYEYNPLIEEAITRYEVQVHHIEADGRSDIDLPVLSFTYDSDLETIIEVKGHFQLYTSLE